jgi:two-component system C4-dicarboxylate transport sensor histidine kinase DctB
LLTYALLQLLQNALTAVSASDVRVIELQVESAAQAVRIHITDSGPGLPEQVILRFSGKYEVWPANLQCMGLFVVNHIIKEQRGALFLDNPPTGGARVTVQLPLDS